MTIRDSLNEVRYGPALTRWLLAIMILVVTLALPATVGWAAEAPVPSAPDRLAAEFGNGIRVTVLDTAGRKPIKEFQVIAGVRSQAGGEQAKEVVNWQPHTLRQGRDGGLVWPLNRAYDEMALRVEPDGCAPQVLAWLKKSQGPQSVAVELAVDKGTTALVNKNTSRPANSWYPRKPRVLNPIRRTLVNSGQIGSGWVTGLFGGYEGRYCTVR